MQLHALLCGKSKSHRSINSERTLCIVHSENPKSAIQNPKLMGLLALVITFALCGAAAQAQQPAKIPRIGYQTGSPGTAANPDPTTHAFRQRLKELGYIEGKNVTIEFRLTAGKGPAVEAEQARELVRLNVDVLFAKRVSSDSRGQRSHQDNSHRHGDHARSSRRRTDR